jgi:hypothetical protein
MNSIKQSSVRTLETLSQTVISHDPARVIIYTNRLTEWISVETSGWRQKWSYFHTEIAKGFMLVLRENKCREWPPTVISETKLKLTTWKIL